MGAALPAVALGANIAGNVHAAQSERKSRQTQAALANAQQKDIEREAVQEKKMRDIEARRMRANTKAQHAQQGGGNISSLSDILSHDQMQHQQSLASLLASSNHRTHMQSLRAAHYTSQARRSSVNRGIRTLNDVLAFKPV